MTERDTGLLFATETEKIINAKLIAIEKKLKNPEEVSYETLYDMVLEANSLILLICGDNFEAYDAWKYRLFVNPDGRVYLTQGAEVDTDYVPDDYKPLDED